MTDASQRQRIDKWLWAARFYKTRSLAVQAIERRHVLVAGDAVKPAREIRVGDVVTVRQGWAIREVAVAGLSMKRGPAPVAQALYQETAASAAARERAAMQRRLAPEPAQSILHGRPTKRDRRALDRERHADWDARWSAASPD